MSSQLAAEPSVSSIRHDLGLSRERLARLLDISSKTVERLESTDSWPTRQGARDRLMVLAEAVQLGRLIYTPEGVRRFLTMPMPVFQHQTALQLIERGNGNVVIAALAADYEGLGT